MATHKLMRFVIALAFLLSACPLASQSVLITYATFEKTMSSVEGYKLLMINDNENAYEAMLADSQGNRYLLTIKEYALCEQYREGGHKVKLADRLAYTIETPSFSMLSAPLPEFMACMHITASAPGMSEKLLSLANRMPFLAASSGSATWPEKINPDCRIPGELLWARTEPASAEGFTSKIVAEIESSDETFGWFKQMPCACKIEKEFADCGAFILYWQQGRLDQLHLKARIGERLRFTYYFR